MPNLFDFWRDESGQDLIEYSLLIMFVAVASAALLGGIQPSTKHIWDVNKEHLASASRAADP